MVFSKVLKRFSTVSGAAILSIAFSMIFLAGISLAEDGGRNDGTNNGDATAADAPVGPTSAGDLGDTAPVAPGTPDDQLQEGDVVGRYDVDLGNEGAGVSLAESSSASEGGDCEELSNYYAYLEGRNEVRCEREDGCNFHCWEVRVNGCFSPDTLILMGDGLQTKRIDAIRRGDLVWNPAAEKAVRVKSVLRGPEANPLIEIGYGNKITRVTDKHPMIVQRGAEKLFHKSSIDTKKSSKQFNARVKKASEITFADRILGDDGEFHQVSVLRTLPVSANQIVINLELEGDSASVQDHLLVADGVITADYFIQRQLSEGK